MSRISLRQSIIMLMIVAICFGSINQLLIPAFGPLLQEQELEDHFRNLMVVGSISLGVASLLTTPIIRCYGAKKTGAVTLAGCALVDCLWVVAIQSENPAVYYIQWGLGSGLNVFPIITSWLLLRRQLKQLGKSHIVGAGITTLLMTVVTAICNKLAFQAEPIVWAYVLVSIKLILALLSFSVKSEAENPPSRGLRGMSKDPATKLAIASLPGLFIFFVVQNLLPISGLMTQEEVGNFLFLSTLLGGVFQWFFSHLCDRYRSLTAGVIWICRAALLFGLIMILLHWWLIGVVLWSIGVSMNILVKSVSVENSEDEIVGNTLPMIAWNIASLLGSVYIWCAGQINLSYEQTLWWILLPAAVYPFLTNAFWQHHKLPPKQVGGR